MYVIEQKFDRCDHRHALAVLLVFTLDLKASFDRPAYTELRDSEIVMETSGITYLIWHDLVGITRTRGIPTKKFGDGDWPSLGWACAGQALTAFQDIVENPWGPMDEVRQVPDKSAAFEIVGQGKEHLPFKAVICDSKTAEGLDWECCGRSFLRQALNDLQRETGLGIFASFEHEFSILGDNFAPSTPFSIAAARQQNAFLTDIEMALRHAGLSATSLEPEFGIGQYEVACAPERDVRAADACIMTREIIRETAIRHNILASFTPKTDVEAVGNGAHIHLSLCDEHGVNKTFDAERPMNLSKVASKFCTGVLKYLEALVALTAPTPISYHRLGPHHWSCGYKAIGLQNREAALRIIPGIGNSDAQRRGHNIEYRPCDGTASPYLALGVIVRAGLEGIRGEEIDLPEINEDPSEMSDVARIKKGVSPLPETLGAALDALENDKVAITWFSKNMLSTYLALKRWEIEQATKLPTAELFDLYRATY